jgi:phosphopantetheinyl transferase
VFTAHELEYIEKTKDPSRMVWQLWSMKESAYKINVKQYHEQFFNPKKIKCILFKGLKGGEVKIDNDYYVTFSKRKKDFIYTIATQKGNLRIKSAYFRFSDLNYYNQHQSCHMKLKEATSELLHIKKESIEIKKCSVGIPKLYKNGNLLDLDCSLTHHGNYGAYAISCV